MRVERVAIVILVVSVVTGGLGWLLGHFFGWWAAVAAAAIGWPLGSIVGTVTFEWVFPE